MTDINGIFSICEAVGTAAFAVSGAMVAVDKGTDIFGVLLMAVFTALGGGTLRDMLIGYFAVSGARIGMEAGFADNMFLTTFLGTTTAIGGGMIRDVLLREMPFVLKKRVYAVAAILGALGYALLLRVGLGEVAAYGLGMLITTAVRMLATVFKWNLPKALE